MALAKYNECCCCHFVRDLNVFVAQKPLSDNERERFANLIMYRTNFSKQCKSESRQILATAVVCTRFGLTVSSH